MIRFIDLEKQLNDHYPRRFTYYNTVSDEFATDRHGNQTWNSWDSFESVMVGSPGYINRFREVSPEWIFSVQESPTTCKKIE